MKNPSARDSLYTKTLLQALARLQPAQGDRARRFARQRVLARLKALRTFVDDVYPAPRREPKPRRKRPLPPDLRDLTRMVPCQDRGHSVKVAKAGIKTLPTMEGHVMMPTWAKAVRYAAPTVKQLREARLSLIARKALLAAARLTDPQATFKRFAQKQPKKRSSVIAAFFGDDEARS